MARNGGFRYLAASPPALQSIFCVEMDRRQVRPTPVLQNTMGHAALTTMAHYAHAGPVDASARAVAQRAVDQLRASAHPAGRKAGN